MVSIFTVDEAGRHDRTEYHPYGRQGGIDHGSPHSGFHQQIMPFQNPLHLRRASEQPQTHDNFYGAANAIYQAGQTLASAGAPTNVWSTAQQESHRQNPSQENIHNASLADSNPPYPYPLSSYSPSKTTYVHAPRNSLGSVSHGDPSFYGQGAAMNDATRYGIPPSYGTDSLPIHLQPSSPPQPQNSASAILPGQLQAGQQSRPPPGVSSNTAPILPTLPQISTQLQQQPAMSTRPVTVSAHSYSRSSPGIMDQQRYKPFMSKSPEELKYANQPGAYAPPPPGPGPSSYSPLGLADIRPRADTTLSDSTFGPSQGQDLDVAEYNINSSYIAPWPIYAVDWCKWTPKGANAPAGKIAIGSYLEDNHNYVRILVVSSTPMLILTNRSKFSMLNVRRSIPTILMGREGWNS